VDRIRSPVDQQQRNGEGARERVHHERPNAEPEPRGGHQRGLRSEHLYELSPGEPLVLQFFLKRCSGNYLQGVADTQQAESDHQGSHLGFSEEDRDGSRQRRERAEQKETDEDDETGQSRLILADNAAVLNQDGVHTEILDGSDQTDAEHRHADQTIVTRG